MDFQRHKQRNHPEKVGQQTETLNLDILDETIIKTLKEKYGILSDFIQWEHQNLAELNQYYSRFNQYISSYIKSEANGNSNQFDAWIKRHFQRVRFFYT